MMERSALHREVANLRDRVDDLEEEVRQLRDAFEPSVALPLAWGVTRMESRLLHILVRARGSYMTKERLLVALYGSEPDVGIKIVEVFIAKLRRRLRQAGSAIVIRTVRGEGFALTAEGLAAFQRETALQSDPRAAQDARVHEWLQQRLAALEVENDRLREAVARSQASSPTLTVESPWWDDHACDRRRHA